MDKKVIARDGLVAIGAFLLVFIFVCLEKGDLDFEYLFEYVPKPFLILYGSYLVVRFLMWSSKTLIEDKEELLLVKTKTKTLGIDRKVLEKAIVVVCILIGVFVILYFISLHDSGFQGHKTIKRF
jgi:hypothetical protein